MQPDLDTLRRVPWQPGTVAAARRRPVARRRATSSPRRGRSCARQLDAARRRRHGRPSSAPSWSSSSSSDTYEEAWHAGYRDLTPANQYNVDYSMLGTARVEPLLRRIRNEMSGAGHDGRVGQGRVQPRPARDRVPYADALTHLRQPRGLQERRQGDRRAGRHVADLHGQVQRARGQLLPHPPVVPRDRRLAGHGRTTTREHGLSAAGPALHRRPAGAHARAHPAASRRTSTPTSASSPGRSPRRRSRGARTTAPARSGWSATAPALRLENRVPGGDVNPYLAIAAHDRRRPATASSSELRAGGRRSPATPTRPTRRAVPDTLREALRAVGRQSRFARADVRRRGRRPLREHGRDRARRPSTRAVTDWERYRGFERL